jgi:phage virion morphogenesis protein
MGIRANIQGASRRLNTLVRRLGGFQVPLKQIIASGVEFSKASFAKQQDPTTGAGWAPLSPAYAAVKRRKGRSSKALILSGNLKRSIREMVITRRMGEWGTDTFYGPFHQFGTGTTSSRSGGTNVSLPARPFIGAPTREQEGWKMKIRDYVLNGRV